MYHLISITCLEKEQFYFEFERNPIKNASRAIIPALC